MHHYEYILKYELLFNSDRILEQTQLCKPLHLLNDKAGYLNEVIYGYPNPGNPVHREFHIFLNGMF